MNNVDEVFVDFCNRISTGMTTVDDVQLLHSLLSLAALQAQVEMVRGNVNRAADALLITATEAHETVH